MNEKELVKTIMEDAEIGEINITALKELIKLKGVNLDYTDISDDLDWALNHNILDGYMWDRVLVDKIGLDHDYDYYFTEDEDMVTDAKEDYDYSEEDFEEITEEELDKLSEKDEIAKYFDGKVLYDLPPFETFEKMINNGNTKFQYGKNNIYINKENEGYYIEANGDWFTYNNLEEVYNFLKDIDVFMQKRYEENHREEIELEKMKKSINERINALNENSTIKDVAEIESSIEVYSDIYKDVEGFRPRTEIGAFHTAMKEKTPAFEEFWNLDFEKRYKLFS